MPEPPAKGTSWGSFEGRAIRPGAMGLQLPEALAGDDNEIDADTEGVMKVLRLTGGVALAGAIVGAGLYLKNRLMNAAGADQASNIGLTVA